MAVVYYPSNTNVYTRIVQGGSLVEMNIGITPNSVFFFTGSAVPFTSSLYSVLGRSIVLCSAYTPTATGPDTAEVSMPFSPNDGTSSMVWNVRRLSLRVPVSETTTSSIQIEKSVGSGLFSSSLVGVVTLNSGSYESQTGSLSTVGSGDKIRFNVTQIGTSMDWTIITEISNG